MAEYKTEEIRATVGTGEYVRECVDVEKFFKRCQECKEGYHRRWSCPPFDFRPLQKWLEYDRLTLIGVAVYFERNTTPEEAHKALGEEKEKRLAQLLEEEKDGTLVLSAGKCDACEKCARENNLPCRKPDKMRYSIESLGGDVVKTAEKYLGKPLLWIKDGKVPEYLTLVFGVLEKKIKNSYKYFQNTACEFFPCHEKTFDGFNCLFCYCPLYKFDKCLGNPKYIEYGDKKIKDCSDCTFPHRAENYEKLMAFFNENL